MFIKITRRKISRALLCVSVLLLGLPALASKGSTATEPSLTLELKSNNLLSIINPILRNDPSAKQALPRYYQEALPLAASYGYRNHGSLRVTETVVGVHQPELFVLATWPDQAADQAFESAPEWEKYKPLRPQIWQTLKFYKAPNAHDKSLTFYQSKHYTMAFAWLNQQHPNDYHQYLAGIEQTVNRLGGTFIHSMKNPRHVSHNEELPGPDEITFVEWENKEALQAFQNSETFRQLSPLLKTGTDKFELYRVAPHIK